MKYRKLTILEIIYFNEDAFINATIKNRLMRQLNVLHNDLLCISIVVNGNLLEFKDLLDFIRSVKGLKTAVSISFYNCKNFESIYSIKNEIGQIRVSIKEDIINVDRLNELFWQLKTPKNNVIFLFEIDQVKRLESYAKLLESNSFIYNISYSSNIDYNSYWNLARYVSDLKERFPLNILQEFTCAGAKFDNIKGICPAKTSLMCIGTDGNITYCYKDTKRHGINLCDGDLRVLFDKLGDLFPKCSNINCSEADILNCQCGCPLDFKDSNNLYCKYNMKGGILS